MVNETADPLIPRISDQKLDELMKDIRPVERFAVQAGPTYTLIRSANMDGILCYLEVIDPRKLSFREGTVPAEVANDIETEHYNKITTFHTYGPSGCFCPTVAEVLAQIPEEELGTCAAFQTKRRQNLNSKNPRWIHTATTYLFRRGTQGVEGVVTDRNIPAGLYGFKYQT